MKTKLILILLLSMTLVFVSCENDSQPLQSISDMQSLEGQSLSKSWEQSAEDLAQKLMDGMWAGDVDAVMSCFWNSPDFIFVRDNGMPGHGWDAMKMRVERIINQTESRELTITEARRFRLGDEVYSAGKATWEKFYYFAYGGEHEMFLESWTNVAKKVGDNWVYVVYHEHYISEIIP